MTSTTIAIANCALLAGLLGTVAMHRRTSEDVFRHRLFRLRDRLFNLAAGGAIPFTHPAYRDLRVTLNGFLRLADSMGTLLLLVALVSRVRAEPGDRWEALLRDLDEGTASAIRAIRSDMHELVSRRVLPPPAVLSQRLLEGAMKRQRPPGRPDPIDRLEVAAFDCGTAPPFLLATAGP